MIHLITALKPEARPLLEHFDLRPLPGSRAFPVYQNRNGDITLTRSGPGKAAAAAATELTRALFKADKSHAWLNIGVAGHASLPLGQAALVAKITDAASGQTWFPSPVFSAAALPVCELLTIEEPCADHQEVLFDMEGAGFFSAVSGCATTELAQTVKVVSDNAEHPPEDLTSTRVSRLLEDNLAVIDALARQLLSLAEEERRRLHPGDDYEALVRGRRFTATQREQLKTLLRKWQALRPGGPGAAELLIQGATGPANAAQIIERLRVEVQNAPIRLTPQEPA